MPAKPIDEVDLLDRLQQVLRAASPGCEVDGLSPLQGGASSITYWTTFTGTDGSAHKVVLKVAPAGLEPTKNRDMLRQARVHHALDGSGVPVPRVLGEHAGTPPDIPPFFVMDFEPGDCIEPNFMAPDERPTPAQVRGRELDSARILGRLHTVDPTAVGLADEPVVTLADELARWTNSLAACDEDLREGSEEVAQLLAETMPPMGPPVLMHGDFRLGNALCLDDRVVCIIDWEIWARGDARVDLGWFLMMANPDETMGRTASAGMPSEPELLDTYQAARGVEVKGLDWFAALVRYKQTATGALIARNARRRGLPETPNGGRAALLASAKALLA